MSTPEDTREQKARARDALTSSLDRHGYTFQFSVLRALEAISRQHGTFQLEVAEFPVGGNPGTRIDFVLRKPQTRFFLSCECKRANPAFSNWFFLHAPYVRRNHVKDQILVEHIRLVNHAESTNWKSLGMASHASPAPYSVAIEAKTSDKKGDPGGGRNGIEAAVSQAFRGSYGLLESLASRRLAPSEADKGHRADATVLPVVFTTAELWTSEADLGDGDLCTGTLAREDQPPPRRTDWLFYQYPVGAPLQHQVDRLDQPRELSDTLVANHLRTIAIVGPRGIESFARTCPILDGVGNPIRWSE